MFILFRRKPFFMVLVLVNDNNPATIFYKKRIVNLDFMVI